MAEVASIDPTVAETVIVDNEEDESKVRGAWLQCVHPPRSNTLPCSVSCQLISTAPPGNSSHETSRRRDGT